MPDDQDNCTTRANPLQIDSDCERFGNVCDADFNNNGIVSGTDLTIFNAGPANNPIFDIAPPFNGVADAADLAYANTLIGTIAGPSGVAVPTGPSCLSTTLPTSHYCLTGTGTGANYGWQLSVQPPFTLNSVTAPPAGSNASTLMMSFQSSIQQAAATTGVSVTGVAFTPAACFALSNPSVTLSVGPSAIPRSARSERPGAASIRRSTRSSLRRCPL